MTKKLPPLNWLRSFESSARHLSFTLAAEELNLTPAAISKQVKNLEFNLGADLFDRLPSGLRLNDNGAAYLPGVRNAIENLASLTNELFGHQSSQVLNLRVSLVFFLSCLAPKLGAFYRQNPDIDLRITSNIWATEGGMEVGTDLEIRHGAGYWPNLTNDRLTWDVLTPVCSPGLLETQPLDKVSDLKQHTLLHVLGYQEGWGQWLQMHGGGTHQLPRNMQFDTMLCAFELAEHGVGVAMGRSSLIEERLKAGRLVTPLAQSMPTQEAFHLTYHRLGRDDSPARRFRDWLLTVFVRANEP